MAPGSADEWNTKSHRALGWVLFLMREVPL